MVGYFLGLLGAIIVFLVQQVIKIMFDAKQREKEYKYAINNYIDYLSHIKGKLYFNEKLLFPYEGPYVKEYHKKEFMDKIERMRAYWSQFKIDEDESKFLDNMKNEKFFFSDLEKYN